MDLSEVVNRDSARRVLTLLRFLPRDGAFWSPDEDYQAGWGQGEHLTATVIDAVQQGLRLLLKAWVTGDLPDVDPVPRPGMTVDEPIVEMSTPEQADAFFGGGAHG